MQRFWRSAVLVALLATQACWLQVGGGPKRQGYTGLETAVTAANVGDLTEAWANPSVVELDPREVLIEGARAYVRSDGKVRALDVSTGATVWTTDTPLGGNQAPALVDGRLHVPVPGGACYLATVDADTGELLDRRLISPPDLNGEPVGYSSCTASDAVAVGSTVAFRWTYVGLGQSAGCSGASIAGSAVTAVDVDGGQDGWVVDDTVLRCGTVPTVVTYGDVSSAGPGGAVVAVPEGVRQVGCTGEGCPEPWAVTTGDTVVGPPVVLHNGDVAVAMQDGRVVVIDGASHAVEWTGQVGSTVSQPLASDPDSIFVAGDAGGVVAFPVEGCGAATCMPSWTATLASPASARPSIGGGVLYVGSADGTVSAFAAAGCDAASCASLWSAATPGRITGAPAIANGRILVGSSTGVITAFALPADGG